MKLSSLIVLLVLLISVSCTRVPTINLEEHAFNKAPDNIVLIQISNFEEDVFAQLKHSQTLIGSRIFTENFQCIGRMWRVNHSTINPSVEDSFFTQLTGFPRSENTCPKFSSETILSEKFIKFGFGSILYERGDSDFINSAKLCNEEIYKNTIVFSSKANKKVSTLNFHAEKKGTYLTDNIYSDESCSTSECFSSLKDNFDHIWRSIKNYPRRVMLVRDSLEKSATKKLKNLRAEQLSDFLNYLSTDFKMKNPTSLVVVTITDENAPLTKVWALGPMSENFCGEFNELDFNNRFFWTSKKSEFFLFKLP